MFEPSFAPPVGFRKAIPASVKLEVVIRQQGRCSACGEPLQNVATTQFDHVPALQLRLWDAAEQDTFPPANSKDHIEAKHKDCHLAKTAGLPSKAASKRGTDITEIARLRRLTRKQEEFRQRLLSKADETIEAPQQRQKYRWPKRPFSKGAKDGPTRKGGQGRRN